jgi:hypothetical protein
MTGFSAKIRPEFAENHNMTLNRTGITGDRAGTYTRQPNRNGQLHTRGPTASNKPRPAAPQPPSDAGMPGGSDGSRDDGPSQQKKTPWHTSSSALRCRSRGCSSRSGSRCSG